MIDPTPRGAKASTKAGRVRFDVAACLEGKVGAGERASTHSLSS